MTCPICNQKIDPSDHSEKWGPEFAHSRCVIAFNAGSAIQDAKLQDRIKRLEKAGDAMADVLTWSAAIQYKRSPTVAAWRKAKEAKP